MRNNIFQEMSNKTSFKHTEKYHNSYLFSKSLSPKMSVVGMKSIRLMMMGRGDCLYKRPLLRTLLRVETGRTSHLRLMNDFWFVFTMLEIPQITDVLHSELSFISI